MSIQISSHEHPLFYEKEGHGKAAGCNECGKALSGPVYGCRSCRFYLHAECLELPQEIQHFLHPCPLYLHRNRFKFECDACSKYYKSGKNSTFRCENCNFNLDISCALAPKMKLEDDDVIQHYSHRHPLKLVHNCSNRESYCEACGKVCPGPAYTCKKCNFFLHDSCLEVPREIQHFFHSCPLILVPTTAFRCYACLKKSCSRLAYKCGPCNFRMGLQCALMSSTIKSGVHWEMIQPEGQDRLEHFIHGHPLLLLELNEGDEHNCTLCKDGICSDLVYGCSRCNFIVHKSCLDIPQEIHHPFHPRHPLTMKLRFYSACRICGSRENDYSLYCCDECDFYLDPSCARLRPSIPYDGHKHLLALLPKRSLPLRKRRFGFCRVCSLLCYENVLLCGACLFIIHFDCHPLLPQILKHECHIHQLILFRTRPEEDKADASGLFWCHACEEERDGELPFYYCRNCRFAAHTKCVASEILPLLTAKEQTLMGSAIEGQSAAKENEVGGGDSTLAKYDNHILEIRAEMDPLVAEEEKLEAEIIRLQTDLKAVKDKIAPLKKNLEAVEGDRAFQVSMFTGLRKTRGNRVLN